MNAVANFQFENKPVRIDGTPDEPLFHAGDLCGVLEYKDPWKAIAQHVEEEDRVKRLVLSNGGNQSANFVNEAGMWSLVLRANTAAAKRVQRWVTREVLPTLRKTGSYSAAGEMLKLDEVHRRTGYTPSALKTRRCRGHYLPFPLHMGDDGRLRVNSRDIDAWSKRVESGEAAKARVVQPKREILPKDVTQREAPPALAPRNSVERLMSKAQFAEDQVRLAQQAQAEVAKEMEVEIRRLIPSVVEMLQTLPTKDHRLIHALNAAAAGKPLQY